MAPSKAPPPEVPTKIPLEWHCSESRARSAAPSGWASIGLRISPGAVREAGRRVPPAYGGSSWLLLAEEKAGP